MRKKPPTLPRQRAGSTLDCDPAFSVAKPCRGAMSQAPIIYEQKK